MVVGVTKGYEKKLEIVGVGYLAAVQKGDVAIARRLRQRSPDADSRRADRDLPRPDARRRQGDRQANGRPVRRRSPRGPQAGAYKGKGIRYEAKWSAARPARR